MNAICIPVPDALLSILDKVDLLESTDVILVFNYALDVCGALYSDTPSPDITSVINSSHDLTELVDYIEYIAPYLLNLLVVNGITDPYVASYSGDYIVVSNK